MGTRATTCHTPALQSVRQGRADARSAVRPRASVRHSVDTTTCASAVRRPARHSARATVRPPGPADTARGRGCDTAGEEAEVADPDEALREDVQQKALQEFV